MFKSLSTLHPVKYGELKRDERFNGEIYTREGIFTNELGERFVLRVSSLSPERIQKYLDNVQVNFKILPPKSPKKKSGKLENTPTRFSASKLLALAKENIRVELGLDAETLEKNPIGLVVFVIDPRVRAGKYDNYAAKDPSNNNASVTISLGRSAGKVEASLYLQCAPVPDNTGIVVNQGTSQSLSGRGSDYFDLTIKGIATSSTYTLRGTWRYGDPIDANSPDITCS